MALAVVAIAGCGGRSGDPATAQPGAAMPSQPHPRESLTSSPAASAFASFTAAFQAASNGQAYYHTSTLGGHTDFWKQAEMIEMVEDAYAAIRSPSYERMVVDLLAGAGSLYGRNWLKRTWKTAWANRDRRGLIGQYWTRPTGNGVLSSFDCWSGVVLMEVITARP